jgi:hypothetical protein
MSDRAMLRLHAARAVAWSLLLGGWIGLAAVAQARSATPLAGFAWIALWLFALGSWTAAMARWRPVAGVRRIAIVVAAIVAAVALALSARGVAWLGSGIVAFALVVALASTTVRACRHAAHQRPGPPFAAAAAGAVLALVVVGEIGGVGGLTLRLGGLAVLAAVALAWLHPARLDRNARSGCGAGLFDCSLPGWVPGASRTPQRWPLMLASLLMLPMMCSLSMMASICRAAATPAPAMLALHLAGMFAPALLLHAAGRALPQRAGAALCAALLGLGAVGLLRLPVPSAWVVVALAHGTAWSVAWSAQFSAASPLRTAPSPLRAAWFNAACALALGLAFAAWGPEALRALHIAIGTAAALSGIVVFAPRSGAWRARQARVAAHRTMSI